MKDVTKDQIIKAIGETQDGGAKTLRDPKDNDFLSQLIKSIVDGAEEVDGVIRDMDYALDQIQKAKAQVEKNFNENQAIV